MADQLSPGTTYTVEVVSVNQQGKSDAVMTTVQTMSPAVTPTDPPVVTTERPPPPQPQPVGKLAKLKV